jgi:hypothetical protein
MLLVLLVKIDDNGKTATDEFRVDGRRSMSVSTRRIAKNGGLPILERAPIAAFHGRNRSSAPAPPLSAGSMYEWRVTRPKPNFAELGAGSGPRRCAIFGRERQRPLSFTIWLGKEIPPYYQAMSWSDRLNTDPLHSWFRDCLRTTCKRITLRQVCEVPPQQQRNTRAGSAVPCNSAWMESP